MDLIEKYLGEALGSNRDYKTRDKSIMKASLKAGYIKLWECPKCGRKNLMKEKKCPRCKENKGDNPKIVTPKE